ncbi:hypothetical protein E2C01_024340 [Portunus trituberculatus]|uniref:Uncharacterized protein n=1 Tax=Portunus trituberculatus TaxID=210409 RepID=A0A5B7EDK1_PORTR|nr:hypothetical protein [Portunus trituberculatus]
MECNEVVVYFLRPLLPPHAAPPGWLAGYLGNNAGKCQYVGGVTTAGQGAGLICPAGSQDGINSYLP